MVDDDPGIFELMCAVADRHPLVDVVAGATSPEEALVLSRRTPPDAILLDHHFPTADLPELEPLLGNTPMRGMTGLEAVEFLRAAAPAAVIAIYSCNQGLAGSAENSGADMYLVKGPNASAALDEVARAAIRRRG